MLSLSTRYRYLSFGGWCSVAAQERADLTPEFWATICLLSLHYGQWVDSLTLSAAKSLTHAPQDRVDDVELRRVGPELWCQDHSIRWQPRASDPSLAA